MKKTRLLWAAIIGLLLLNLATIGFVLRPSSGKHPRNGEGGLWRYVNSTLALSPQQQEVYTQMRNRHRAQMNRLTADYQERLRPYLSLLQSPAPDTLQKAALEAEMTGIERQKLRITFAHFEELKAICTPEQQQRFPQMIPRLAEVLCGPPPPREERPGPERP